MQRRHFLAGLTAATTLGTAALTAQAASTEDKPTEKPFTVKAGEARFGVHTPFRGINGNDIKVSGKDTGGQFALFEYVGNEKTGPSLHVHHEQDEIFSIIEGEYLFRVGDNEFTAKAGDTVFAPRGIPHTWLQLSEKGRQLYMVQPAGKMEEFFLKMNELKGPPTEKFMLGMHKAHGMTVLGPPMTLK
ncbi:MAG: cupin domain-containing protein [Cytophagales bacterium]|nr:MAG: cupin domain-containing protein [Cytophagales bacterium]